MRSQTSFQDFAPTCIAPECTARQVFADDVRASERVFHLYYVLALDAAHGFFILRVPVSPDARSSFRYPTPFPPRIGRNAKSKICSA